ncbi:hypothetical protein OAR82_03470 [Candidatus Pelagibacter sp.]|nr:hypothetical protein [Candidatus Pelagibacter sp.]
MKIALLGAGLGSVGSYLALKKLNLDKNVTIFNSSYKITHKKVKWTSNNLKNNYQYLFKKNGFKTLNNKSVFGEILKMNKNIWDNNFSYGMSKFWGGVIQIPSNHIIKKNFSKNFRVNSFKSILNEIPTTLPTNKLLKNSYKNFYSQNTIKCHPIILKVLEKFSNLKNQKTVNYGINSVAINNNGKSKNDCINCSNCIIGCPQNSFFSSERFYKGIKTFDENIEKVDIKKNLIITKNSKKYFDKIIFNLGPYYNQKLLLNNFDNLDNILIKDSFSYTIPIYYKGKIKNYNSYYGLTNLTANFLNKKFEDYFTVQFFPPNNHIIHSLNLGHDNYLTDLINNNFLKKFIFARVYLSDKYSKKIIYRKDNTTQSYSKDTKQIKNKIFKMLNSVLLNDFSILKFTINSSTSSHYTGYNPILKKNIDNFEYKKNFVVPDSTFWKINPSISPSLSIMAGSYDYIVNSKLK